MKSHGLLALSFDLCEEQRLWPINPLGEGLNSEKNRRISVELINVRY